MYFIKTENILKFILSFLFFCLSINHSLYATNFSKKRNEKILIFHGKGVCEGCSEELKRFLTSNGFEVHLITPGNLKLEKLNQASLFIQPGGSDRILDTLEVLKKNEIQNLKQWIENGGRYLGICAGGYLASVFTEDDEDKLVPAYGLFPELVDQEISSDNNAKLIEVIWLGKKIQVYYQAGPYFNLSKIENKKIYGTYSMSGHVAAFMYELKRGRVGLIGPHIEATKEWFIEDKIKEKFIDHHELLLKFIKDLLN